MSIVPPNDIPISLDYTSRDYYSLREQLIARVQDRLPNWTATNPADFGVALVEAFAYLGDMLSYYIDRSVNEAFISTATQRDSVINIAQTYGYTPAGYRQAFTVLEFSNSSNTTVTIPKGTVVSGDIVTGDVVNTVYFTTQSDLLLDPTINNGVQETSATEGRSVSLVSTYANQYGELVGTSNGLPNQKYVLSETPVVDGSLSVYVQGGSSYTKWSEVTHIIDYGPADQVFSVSTDENNNVYVNFGDGVSGAIPVNFSQIRVLYTVGGGELGNVPLSSLTSLESVPGLTSNELIALQAIVTVTNTSTGSGGSDPETLSQVRYAAPLTLRTNTRAVTLEDFKNLALGVTNCGKANAYAETWSSVTLYVAPSRNPGSLDQEPGLTDGVANQEYTTLAEDVTSALSSRMLIGTSLTVQPPTYVDIVLTVDYSKKAQYTVDEIELAIRKVLTSSYGYVNSEFEQTIYQQDIEATLNSTIPGLKIAKVSAMHRSGGSGLATLVGAPNEIFRIKEENITIGTL